MDFTEFFSGFNWFYLVFLCFTGFLPGFIESY